MLRGNEEGIQSEPFQAVCASHKMVTHGCIMDALCNVLLHPATVDRVCFWTVLLSSMRLLAGHS